MVESSRNCENVAGRMNKDLNSRKENKAKGFFARLVEKVDKKIEEKANGCQFKKIGVQICHFAGHSKPSCRYDI